MNTTSIVHLRTKDRLAVLQIIVVVVGSAILATFLTNRLSITADPRMVLQPWLLNQGFVPYLHIADEHSPLLPQLLAWLHHLVGHDGILALRIAHTTTLSLLFVLLNGWLWRRYGLWAMIAGFAFTWAFAVRFGLTTFWYNLALAPVFFAYFILLSDFSTYRLTTQGIGSGLLIGLGVLLKQQAIVLAPVFVIWLAILRWKMHADARTITKLFLAFGAGAAIPLLLYLAYYLVSGGELGALIEWTLLFNMTSGYAQMGFLLPTHLDMLAIWPAFVLVLPFAASLFQSHSLDRQEQLTRLWLLICAISSLVFLYPRYSVPHWAAAFAFVAATSAVACADLAHLASLITKPAAHRLRQFAASFILFWVIYGAFLFWPAIAGTNQPRLLKFDDQQELAALLAAKLPSDSTIAFIPDNEAVSNAYYGLQRTPPRFWMMHYPWFMQPAVRERWLAELDRHPPDSVVWIDELQDLSSTGPEIQPFIHDRYTETDSFLWQGRTVRLMQRK